MFEDDEEEFDPCLSTGNVSMFQNSEGRNPQPPVQFVRPPVNVLVSNKPYLPFFVPLALALLAAGILTNLPEIAVFGASAVVACLSAILFTSAMPGAPSSRWTLVITLAGASAGGAAAYFWRGWGGWFVVGLSGLLAMLALIAFLYPLLRGRVKAEAASPEDEEGEHPYSAEEINELLGGLITACNLLSVRWKPKNRPQYTMSRNKDLENIRKSLECLLPIVDTLNFLPSPILGKVVEEMYGFLDAVRKVLMQSSFCPDQLAADVLSEVARYINASLNLILLFTTTSDEHLEGIEPDIHAALKDARTAMVQVNVELERVVLAAWNDAYGELDGVSLVDAIQEKVMELVGDEEEATDDGGDPDSE